MEVCTSRPHSTNRPPLVGASRSSAPSGPPPPASDLVRAVNPGRGALTRHAGPVIVVHRLGLGRAGLIATQPYSDDCHLSEISEAPSGDGRGSAGQVRLAAGQHRGRGRTCRLHPRSNRDRALGGRLRRERGLRRCWPPADNVTVIKALRPIIQVGRPLNHHRCSRPNCGADQRHLESALAAAGAGAEPATSANGPRRSPRFASRLEAQDAPRPDRGLAERGQSHVYSDPMACADAAPGWFSVGRDRAWRMERRAERLEPRPSMASASLVSSLSAVLPRQS